MKTFLSDRSEKLNGLFAKRLHSRSVRTRGEYEERARRNNKTDWQNDCIWRDGKTPSYFSARLPPHHLVLLHTLHTLSLHFRLLHPYFYSELFYSVFDVLFVVLRWSIFSEFLFLFFVILRWSQFWQEKRDFVVVEWSPHKKIRTCGLNKGLRLNNKKTAKEKTILFEKDKHIDRTMS